MGLILLVEDENDLREAVGEALELEGYTVQQASTGREAERWLRSRVKADLPMPGLILLDVLLPQGDGLELYTELQRSGDYRDIPVVVVSSSRTLKNFTWAVDLHGFPQPAQLQKPLDLSRLMRVVKGYFT